jgi:hypothetical protein
VEEGGAVVQGETALELVPGVALAAVLAEQGDDLVVEVDRGGNWGDQTEQEQGGKELHGEGAARGREVRGGQ